MVGNNSVAIRDRATMPGPHGLRDGAGLAPPPLIDTTASASFPPLPLAAPAHGKAAAPPAWVGVHMEVDDDGLLRVPSHAGERWHQAHVRKEISEAVRKIDRTDLLHSCLKGGAGGGAPAEVRRALLPEPGRALPILTEPSRFL